MQSVVYTYIYVYICICIVCVHTHTHTKKKCMPKLYAFATIFSFYLLLVQKLQLSTVLFVINWDVFVLSNARSKNQPLSSLNVSAAAVCMLFSLLLCVWVPQAQVLSPPSPAVHCLCFCGEW